MGNIDITQLLNYGALGVITAFLLLRIEKGLSELRKSMNRQTKSILVLTFTLASKNKEYQDLVTNLMKEIDEDTNGG